MLIPSHSFPKIKLLLITTLDEMLKDVTIDDITTTSIVQKSGITRSTFYTHYKDKYALFEDLVLYIYSEIINNLRFKAEFSSNQELLEQFKDNYVRTLHQLYDHRHIFAQIPARSRLTVIGSGIDFSKEHFLDQFKKMNFDSPLTTEYAVNFFLSGLFLTYELWINNQFDLPIDELSDQLTQLTALQFNLCD
ncbi:TetR/AcrR family transcriptional regulator [Macrococcus bovicus]|uniref:TetR/AcrR family transcriptional regulator n=1 Tax=Macrococcus bovicus TaxID=69968 RepID=UPI0025A5202A|nr:TetR/AcrR family transcriptional regulator [Macrococcus bovicus]WJP97930.1 TetR/AcrR family transcriptional regulator [Macrococcus bovicus]